MTPASLVWAVEKYGVVINGDWKSVGRTGFGSGTKIGSLDVNMLDLRCLLSVQVMRWNRCLYSGVWRSEERCAAWLILWVIRVQNVQWMRSPCTGVSTLAPWVFVVKPSGLYFENAMEWGQGISILYKFPMWHSYARRPKNCLGRR